MLIIMGWALNLNGESKFIIFSAWLPSPSAQTHTIPWGGWLPSPFSCFCFLLCASAPPLPPAEPSSRVGFPTLPDSLRCELCQGHAACEPPEPRFSTRGYGTLSQADRRLLPHRVRHQHTCPDHIKSRSPQLRPGYPVDVSVGFLQQAVIFLADSGGCLEGCSAAGVKRRDLGAGFKILSCSTLSFFLSLIQFEHLFFLLHFNALYVSVVKFATFLDSYHIQF